MIKSLTLKTKTGELLLKVLCRKDGTYEMNKIKLLDIVLDVRDEKMQKIMFGEEKT